METVKSHIANALEVAKDKARYDENAKKVLSDKYVLGWIMKETVDEYRGMPLETVIECIEGSPEIGKVPVYPGKTPEAIIGTPTDDKVPNEGEITFDIRFHAVTPDKQHIKLYLNVEVQNKYNPGYDLVTRGVFYGARMLSSQLDTEFAIPHYDDIKKVYSIWICINCPKYAQNTITEYHIAKENIFGNFNHKTHHDLLSVLMVCLGEENDTGDGSVLHKILSTLLSSTLTPEEKEETLTNEFEFKVSRTRKELLNNMCNLSDGIEEKGRKLGALQGELQGKLQGKLQADLKTAKNLFEDGLPFDKVKQYLPDLSESDIEKVQAEVADERKGA